MMKNTVNKNESAMEGEEVKDDKQSPMSSGGGSDLGSTSQRTKKNASQPGGPENAAGTDEKTDQDHYQAKIGSGPVPTDSINRGER
jgi:hypothetical protein